MINVLKSIDRYILGRALSDCARDMSGRSGFAPEPAPRFRIGITGSPGSGKSSLVGVLAAKRIGMTSSLAVLAIDPTSPVSQGSVLGDRIRMDAVSCHPGVYIRSLPSRAAHDGLCDNLEALMRTLERADFEEIMLETVGVGQVQHAVRSVTDTVVMVHTPNSGDTVQAMKAGLVEMADIFVINKADLPDADRAAMEIKAALVRDRSEAAWRPPVILTSSFTGLGVAELSDAIDSHRKAVVEGRDAKDTARRRMMHHVGELLHRRISQELSSFVPYPDADFQQVFQNILKRIQHNS